MQINRVLTDAGSGIDWRQLQVYLPVLIATLRDEVLLELAEELEIEEVIRRERLFSDHGLHRLHVLADGVARVELVRHVRVVLPGHALADGGLHETRERRQHVDRRVDLSVVQLTIYVDLALRDVSSQIGDGVSDVIVGHRQNWYLKRKRK